MSWFRENLRTLTFVANDPKLSNWYTELVESVSQWEKHITERANNKSSREKEFIKKLRLFNELEASLLSINQHLLIAKLDSTDPASLGLNSESTEFLTQQLAESKQQALDVLSFLETKAAKEEGSLLHIGAPIKLFTWEVEDNRYVKFSLVPWLEQITALAELLAPASSGDLTVIQSLKQQTSLSLEQINAVLEIDRNLKKAQAILTSLINSLKPWRKGPYKYLGQEVDAEWRSDLKWLRICDHLDLKDKYVLDVGSGNGYHIWCMKQKQYQAKAVFAIEPFENFSLQHLISVILSKFTYVDNTLSLTNLISIDTNSSSSNLCANGGNSNNSPISSSGNTTNSSSNISDTSLQQSESLSQNTKSYDFDLSSDITKSDYESEIKFESQSESKLDPEFTLNSKPESKYKNESEDKAKSELKAKSKSSFTIDLNSAKDTFIQAVTQLTANAYSTNLIAPFMLPLPLQQVPAIAKFDVVFNMGVLYHRKDPIAFLEDLKAFLFDRPDSTLVLETLVIDGDINTCLIPESKYAGMDNVYHIPSIPMLERWLNIAGFKQTKIIDLTVTTPEEQRATPLSSPISLIDFLDANDQSLTVEGYPAPKRVTILASRG